MDKKDVRRLKRLARDFAEWWAEMTWLGSRPPEEHRGVRDSYRKAHKRLNDALDALATKEVPS